MKALKSSFFGNNAVGLFSFATSSYVFAPPAAPSKFRWALSQLGEVVELSLYESQLLGIHVQVFKDTVAIPADVPEEEKAVLKERVEVVELPIPWNAVRNHLVFNQKRALINPRLERYAKDVEDVLGVEVVPFEIANYKTVGSLLLLSERGAAVGYVAKDEEIERLKELLGYPYPPLRATVNMGSQFLYLGVVYNEKGMVVGEGTTGIEIARLQEALFG